MMLFRILLLAWFMAILDFAHQIYAQDLKHTAVAAVLVYMLTIGVISTMED